jgi:hypothetical protein
MPFNASSNTLAPQWYLNAKHFEAERMSLEQEIAQHFKEECINLHQSIAAALVQQLRPGADADADDLTLAELNAALQSGRRLVRRKKTAASIQKKEEINALLLNKKIDIELKTFKETETTTSINNVRIFHAARLSFSRAASPLISQPYEHYTFDHGNGNSQTNPQDYEHGPHAIETALIVGSLLYIPLILEVFRPAQNEEDALKKWFQVRDAVVWTFINICRLDGAGVFGIDTAKQLSEFLVNSANAAVHISASLLLIGYIFDLLNQLYYDYQRYQETLKKLAVSQDKIAELETEFNSEANPDLKNEKELEIIAEQRKEEKLISELRTFRTFTLGSNVVYAGGLTTGASITLHEVIVGGAAAVTPIGIGFIIGFTLANQLKNLYVEYQSYKEVCQSYNTKLACLEMVKKSTVNRENLHAVNMALVKAGLVAITAPIDTQAPIDIEAYYNKQKSTIDKEKATAYKKLKFSIAWYALLMTITLLLLLSGVAPVVGIGLFVIGMLIYGLVKHFTQDEKKEENKSASSATIIYSSSSQSKEQPVDITDHSGLTTKQDTGNNSPTQIQIN